LLLELDHHAALARGELDVSRFSVGAGDVKCFERNRLLSPIDVYTITPMEIEFDPAKDAINLKKHGLSLALARDLAWDEAVVKADDRYHYDEIRMNVTIPMGNRLYRISFTEEDEIIRVFSCAMPPTRRKNAMSKETLKTRSGREIVLNTDEEEAAIRAGIAQDPDNPEWTEEDFARARPAREVLPPALYEALTKKPVRPRLDIPKVFTGIRFDADVLDGLRATGKGWQTRVNDAMREWLKTHRAA
jgi:uncharacterized protein (DUF4415 family)